MYEWRTGRSCVFKNNVHLVFVTKYRQNALTLEMLDMLKAIFKETCEQLDCELHGHVHLMVSAILK
jgi:putative transposase